MRCLVITPETGWGRPEERKKQHVSTGAIAGTSLTHTSTHAIIDVTEVWLQMIDGQLGMTGTRRCRMRQSKGVWANETEREGCEGACVCVCVRTWYRGQKWNWNCCMYVCICVCVYVYIYIYIYIYTHKLNYWNAIWTKQNILIYYKILNHILKIRHSSAPKNTKFTICHAAVMPKSSWKTTSHHPQNFLKSYRWLTPKTVYYCQNYINSHHSELGKKKKKRERRLKSIVSSVWWRSELQHQVICCFCRQKGEFIFVSRSHVSKDCSTRSSIWFDRGNPFNTQRRWIFWYEKKNCQGNISNFHTK